METTRSAARVPGASGVGGEVVLGPWRDKINAVGSTARTKVMEANDRVRGRLTETRGRVLGSLRSKTVAWAGIAAGAGFGLGLMTRMIRYRMKSRSLPEVVVIEAC